MPREETLSSASTFGGTIQRPKAQQKRLLIAASGTGGHLFPALAVAEQLPDYRIEWLGVPDRLETRLVPTQYPLHTIAVEGFQKQFGFGSLVVFSRLAKAVVQVRRLLQQGQFSSVFTTGGYIAAPAIIAGRSLGLPTVLHESNALPGKVSRWLSPWCSSVALGFTATAQYLPQARCIYVGTPVRSEFLQPSKLELDIPAEVRLIVVAGGSQGAVAINRLVRHCAIAWLDEGIWVVHLTGDNDPEVRELTHPHYLPLPFYHNMAGLLQRADLAISRAGAGTLTELAATATPAILIPFPYAAEDHQTYNANIFASTGAAKVFSEASLTPEMLTAEILNLLRSPQTLANMSQQASSLAVPDSTVQLAQLIRQLVESH